MADATVKGGYWGDISSDFNLVDGDNPLKHNIAQALNAQSLKALRRIMFTLDGVVAGTTATETHKRVLAGELGTQPYSQLGGVRTIETVTDVNRATVAGDVTEINTDLLAYASQPTYVANGDGNPRSYPGG